jgi:hypothetical protein
MPATQRIRLHPDAAASCMRFALVAYAHPSSTTAAHLLLLLLLLLLPGFACSPY